MEGERGLSATDRVVVLVKESDHGRIIGKQGATIKELEQSFNVKIKLQKGSEDVEVQGPSHAGVQGALARIAQIIGYAPRPKTGATAVVVAAPPRRDLTAATIREALFFPDPTQRSYETFLSYLRSARRTIDVAVFTISDNTIADVLIDLHKNQQVRVRVITDNGTVSNKGSEISRLASVGIDVRADGELTSGTRELSFSSTPAPEAPEELERGLRASFPANANNAVSSLMHHKFAVLDGCVLINGSYNWTSTASSLNSENVTITNDAVFVKAFAAQFEQLYNLFANYRIR